MRHVAKLLQMSPGGAHKILKQLEADHVVVPEKIGTGIFYTLNLGSKVVRNLLAFILAQHELDEKKYQKMLEFPHCAALLVTDQKRVALFLDPPIPSPVFGEFAPENLVCSTVEEFYQNLLKRDKETLTLLRDAAILHGEEIIIQEVKKIKGYF